MLKVYASAPTSIRRKNGVLYVVLKSSLSITPVLIVSSLFSQLSLAQTVPGETLPMENIVVFGRNTELLGTTNAASEGTVSGADMLVRPMLRIAEILEVVPLSLN